MREFHLLIDRFVRNDIDYGVFRREVVSRFLALADQDPIIRQVYDSVEGMCSAFDNNYIDQARLNEMLRTLPKPIEENLKTANAAVNIISVSMPVRAFRIVPTSNWMSSPDIVAPANRQVAVEDLLARV